MGLGESTKIDNINHDFGSTCKVRHKAETLSWKSEVKKLKIKVTFFYFIFLFTHFYIYNNTRKRQWICVISQKFTYNLLSENNNVRIYLLSLHISDFSRSDFCFSCSQPPRTYRSTTSEATGAGWLCEMRETNAAPQKKVSSSASFSITILSVAGQPTYF